MEWQIGTEGVGDGDGTAAVKWHRLMLLCL